MSCQASGISLHIVTLTMLRSVSGLRRRRRHRVVLLVFFLTSASKSKVGVADGKLDMFCITKRGLQCVQATQILQNPVLLAKYRLHTCSASSDYSELDIFEAMLELGRHGWIYEARQPSKKVPSYKPGERRIWYFSKSLNLPYLRSLLLADALFRLGLVELPHFQPSQFYKTLLTFMSSAPTRLNEVLPNQSHSYYKVLQQRKAVSSRGINIELEEERGSAGLVGWC